MSYPNIETPKRLKNIGISDLWFNYDHESTDVDIMLQDARIFIVSLMQAGVPDRSLPEPYELVEDFFSRL
jgi:hypothetical protein